RNSASVITARRRLLLRPSLRRCRLASRRVDPFSAVTSSFALEASCWPLPLPPLPLPLRPPRPPLRRRRRREDPWDSPSPPLWSCWSPSWSLLAGVFLGLGAGLLIGLLCGGSGLLRPRAARTGGLTPATATAPAPPLGALRTVTTGVGIAVVAIGAVVTVVTVIVLGARTRAV